MLADGFKWSQLGPFQYLIDLLVVEWSESPQIVIYNYSIILKILAAS